MASKATIEAKDSQSLALIVAFEANDTDIDNSEMEEKLNTADHVNDVELATKATIEAKDSHSLASNVAFEANDTDIDISVHDCSFYRNYSNKN